jgi:hypothetical protein
MKHPGHTYGGFVSTISEQGMTLDFQDFEWQPAGEKGK